MTIEEMWEEFRGLHRLDEAESREQLLAQIVAKGFADFVRRKTIEECEQIVETNWPCGTEVILELIRSLK